MVEARRRQQAVLGDQRGALVHFPVKSHLRRIIHFDGFGGVSDEKVSSLKIDLLRRPFAATSRRGGAVQRRTRANQHAGECRAIGIRRKVSMLWYHSLSSVRKHLGIWREHSLMVHPRLFLALQEHRLVYAHGRGCVILILHLLLLFDY